MKDTIGTDVTEEFRPTKAQLHVASTSVESLETQQSEHITEVKTSAWLKTTFHLHTTITTV